MVNKLDPEPAGEARESIAAGQRIIASVLRQNIEPATHVNNGELEAFDPGAPASFTKGLPHNEYGIADAEALSRFVDFINQTGSGFAYPDPQGEKIAMGPQQEDSALSPGGYGPAPDMMPEYQVKTLPNGRKAALRTWESPLAGHVYELEGADAAAVTIPPAPRLGSGELTVEMAEVYALALLRDFPFSAIASGGASPDPAPGAPADAQQVFDALNRLSWFTAHNTDPHAEARRRARLDDSGLLTPQVAYRGSTAGAKAGPYISQFMLIGNAGREDPASGAEAGAAYGSRVRGAGADAQPGAYNIRGMLPVSVDAETAAAMAGGAESGSMAAMARAAAMGPRKAEDGYILYGAQEINQRISAHAPHVDHMSDWANWIDVQSGANHKDNDFYAPGGRFIATPRDLASYVHFDALYQAYLNACLLLLGYGVPFDRGFPEGAHTSGPRDAFATFGGPHVLSLVTEVASRALKLARRQKYNIHLRARPEAIAGVLALAAHDDAKAQALGPAALAAARESLRDFEKTRGGDGVGLLEMIQARNAAINGAGADLGWIDPAHNYLLPMAFPEGSPMHPSYAAGHATVAGACVTILKAFFDLFTADSDTTDVRAPWTETPFADLYGKDQTARDGVIREGFVTGIFEPTEDAKALRQLACGDIVGDVTLSGELDKLAANISIGRDMAGVHYYTDYYESLRMGERYAVAVLQEQMLLYPEPVAMSLRTFDGENMRIAVEASRVGIDARVDIAKDGAPISYAAWHQRASGRGGVA